MNFFSKYNAFVSQYHTLHGIVLRLFPVKNSDYVVHFFSQEQGKIALYAHGVKKQGSKLGPFLRIGAILKIDTVKTKSNMMNIKHIQSVFLPEITSYEALQHFEEALEYTNQLCKEQQTLPEVFRLLSDYISHYCHSKKPELFSYAYSLKILTKMGFLGDIKCCCVCHKSIEENKHFLDTEHGIRCNHCSKNEKKIDTNTLKILYFLQQKNFKDIEKLSINEKEKKEIEYCVDLWTRNYLHKPLKSKMT